MTCVLVCGGRDFDDSTLLFGALDGIRRGRHFTRLVHGAARGADTLAGQWAKSQGLTVVSYPADWKRNGRSAGPVRNRFMLEQERPDLVVAFPGGKGTENMVKIAREAGVEVVEINRGGVV